DVDKVIHDAALAAHDEVEVAQADIEVDDGDFFAGPRQARGQRRAGGGLANPTFAGSDDDDFCQGVSPSVRGDPAGQVDTGRVDAAVLHDLAFTVCQSAACRLPAGIARPGPPAARECF